MPKKKRKSRTHYIRHEADELVWHLLIIVTSIILSLVLYFIGQPQLIPVTLGSLGTGAVSLAVRKVGDADNLTSNIAKLIKP